MKRCILSLVMVLGLTSICAQSTADNANTFDPLDTIILDGNDYALSISEEATSFKLKIETLNATKTSLPVARNISKEMLVIVVTNLAKTITAGLADSDISTDELAYLLGLKKRIDEFYEKRLRSQLSESQNSQRDVDKEKDQYSALMVLNEVIPYKTSIRPEDEEVIENKIRGLDSVRDREEIQLLKTMQRMLREKEDKKAVFDGEDTLTISDAKISFFNNKASSIYIKAVFTRNGKSENLIFVNNSYSVALRYFNRYGSTVSALTQDREVIRIDYNDVFDYESDQNFNYSIANSQISLSNSERPKNSHKAQVVQRRFFDFFTAVVYSDVMGFNSENSNAILNAQAKLLIPLNLRNIEFWNLHTFSWIRQFTTTANIALDNSFQDESRFINIKDDDTFSSFDLLRKNNLYGKVALDVLSHEAKGWFATISLGYNVAFYRTGLRYTETQNTTEDVVTEQQLMSIGHGPYLNWEIRPQNNFGADLTLSLEDLNYADNQSIGSRAIEALIPDQDQKDHFVMPYNLINIEANFYWLTNPEKSKGGIYAKVGSYFHTESNSIFPQVQVGYATNLTSFVNKFNSSKTKDTTSKN